METLQRAAFPICFSFFERGQTMKKLLFPLSLFVLNVVVCSQAFAVSPFYLPADFPEQPLNWNSSDEDNKLSNGMLQLGSSAEVSDMVSNQIALEPRKLYRSSFKLSKTGLGGKTCVCCGSDFFNFDFSAVNEDETPTVSYSEIFFVPEANDGQKRNALARFAKWESSYSYLSTLPEWTPVQPVFSLLKNNEKQILALGDGENIGKDGTYSFAMFSASEVTDYERPLFSTTASFNTKRWGISEGSYVVYRMALEPIEVVDGVLQSVDPIPFVSGKINVFIGYYVAGKLIVEASCDNENWTVLGELSGVSSQDFSLDALLTSNPNEVYVRFRGCENDDKRGCNIQVHNFSASLKTEQDDNKRFAGRGKTLFATLSDNEVTDGQVDGLLWGIDEDNNIWGYERDTNKALTFTWDSEFVSVCDSEIEDASLSNAPNYVDYCVNFKKPVKLVRKVYPYFKQCYTSEISGLTLTDRASSGADLSWCDASYRVPLIPESRIIKAATVPTMRSAKNDLESFQIVLHTGDKELKNITAQIADELKDEAGHVIPSGTIQLRYAYYHYVETPTDSYCASGWYPDALVPFEQGADGLGAPIDLGANQNLPVWITVKVDSNVTSGKYRGSVVISANDGDFSATVPFALVVNDFSLPVKNTIETAYGLSYNTIDKYHNLTSEADRRAVYEKYYSLFSDYRISMYDPTPLDPIVVEWAPKADPPQCKIDFTAFDKEIKRVFSKYHFTNFSLRFLGLGGGTYQSRHEGSLAGYDANTPEYQAMMADYGSKMQAHLQELDLLDSAYIYSFDEPEEKDYEFVANEFAKLSKYAPKINRMLTEEPSAKFEKILADKGTSINIWCPLSPNYSDETAKQERKDGNRFWWYVCCSPKAPYCTEFTDHPALELRMWHWQTYKNDIAGCLVWTSNYWNSPTAFPDSYQNPYEDPACYVSDSSYPKGTKVLWGNGDGRFVYPPLSAAVPGRNNGNPIYDEPCASIRWEMIREGVEDYEMFVILENLLKEKGNTLSQEEKEQYENLLDFSSLTKDMTHFTSNPQDVLNRRQEIMNAIVELIRL